MKKSICLVLALMIVLGAVSYFLYTWKAPTPPDDEIEAEGDEEGGEEEVELNYSDSVDWGKFRNKGISINVYNWGEYIAVDEGDGEFDTNTEFEKLTGINVVYSTFATNEELYAKLKGGGTKYDIIIPSDYMISRMINEGMLEKLDLNNIPNVEYIDKTIDSSYDPTGEYSVPYMWGVVGIIYNTKLVDENDDFETWDILWDPKYMGSILMFSSPRDAFGIAEKKLGYSYNTEDPDELAAAAELLKEQKPLVQAYVADEVFDKMGGGEAALAVYYAGDAITMMGDNPDLAFAVPREGTNIYTDAMCIPKGAPNKEAAEMYINFMCETKTALANVEYTCYSTPHTEAYENLDEETQTSVSYPDDEVKAKGEVYRALSDQGSKLLDEYWTDIMSSGNSNPVTVIIFIAACVAAIVLINVYKHNKKKKIELEKVESLH
ncbi:MAG: ABC transporter substrate-binding protein [Clostridia bacterium]|nr:ABC transporter substrate-binding protein [Clostridia bacterium]